MNARHPDKLMMIFFFDGGYIFFLSEDFNHEL